MKINLQQQLEDLEVDLIIKVLTDTGSISGAAKQLSIHNRTTLTEKMKARGIVLVRNGYKIIKILVNRKENK